MSDVVNRLVGRPPRSIVRWVAVRNADQYLGMVQQFRIAAGPAIWRDIRSTMSGAAIMALNVTRIVDTPEGATRPGQPITLYYDAVNLYFLGWSSDEVDWLYQIDGSALSGRLGWTGQTLTLPFREDYLAIERAAGYEERGEMQISRESIESSLQTMHDGVVLENRTSVREAARAVLRMITITSEAARFHSIAQGVSNAYRAPEAPPYRLTPLERNLETDWGRISDYVRQLTQRGQTNPELHVGPAGNSSQSVTLHNFIEVSRYVALISGEGT